MEFILIEGVNDTAEQAQELVKIARRLHAHVNCAPAPASPASDFHAEHRHPKTNWESE